MSKYIERQVPSGITVFIRSRTYPEWEEQENARLETLESLPEMVAAGDVQKLELTLQRANLAVRSARLHAWVKDFDTVKENLTLRDVAEIEQAALELEKMEIPLGNLDGGGNGLLTENDTLTAPNAESGMESDTK